MMEAVGLCRMLCEERGENIIISTDEEIEAQRG